jgi:hypothetical protein
MVAQPSTGTYAAASSRLRFMNNYVEQLDLYLIEALAAVRAFVALADGNVHRVERNELSMHGTSNFRVNESQVQHQ